MSPVTQVARKTIFDAIEAHDRARQTNRSPTQAEIETEAAALLEDIASARPALEAADPVTAFLARASGPKVNATTARCDTLHDVPAEIATLLDGLDRSRRLTLQPHAALTSLPWVSAGIELSEEVDDGAYVTLAPYAIAETGSIVLHSGPQTPILPNLLAAVQIVVVRAEDIVGHLEDYTSRIRQTGLAAPRNLCLMTGPSGTSDIEGAFVRGAHGPSHVHIIVLDGMEQPLTS